MRKLEQGREVTPEEKAEGHCIGFRDMTPEEKTFEALQAMKRHIQSMVECNDALSQLRQEEK